MPGLVIIICVLIVVAWAQPDSIFVGPGSWPGEAVPSDFPAPHIPGYLGLASSLSASTAAYRYIYSVHFW